MKKRSVPSSRAITSMQLLFKVKHENRMELPLVFHDVLRVVTH